MRNIGGIAALVTALVLACGVIAWEWYSRIGTAAQPVAAVTATPASPSAAPQHQPGQPVPSATEAPIAYVPAASASPAVSASPAPAASATAAAHAQPVQTQAPSQQPRPYNTAPVTIREEPMVAATVAPHIMSVQPILEAPDAPPRILALSLSTPVAHSGEVVSGFVKTTSNVASVEARIAGYTSSMQKVGIGKFVLTYRVPNLPFFLHNRTYAIEVTARNTRGDAVHSSVPITIR